MTDFNPAPHVNAKYGAPMGRDSDPLVNFNALRHVGLVQLRWTDGDYDQGGAYWGNGSGDFVFCAYQLDEAEEEMLAHYFRAKSFAAAVRFLTNVHGFSFSDETLAMGAATAMVEAYIAAALWSSNDESTEDGGSPLDDNYGPDDLDPDLRAEMIDDCQDFIRRAPASLGDQETIDWDQLGHDFWLTRNGHGAGFWDGDWPEPLGKELTELSKTFGEVNLYVGEDGKIYS